MICLCIYIYTHIYSFIYLLINFSTYLYHNDNKRDYIGIMFPTNPQEEVAGMLFLHQFAKKMSWHANGAEKGCAAPK